MLMMMPDLRFLSQVGDGVAAYVDSNSAAQRDTKRKCPLLLPSIVCTDNKQ